MSKIVINTENAPSAIGPYSQAISNNDEMIFTAGQLGIDPETGKLISQKIEDQTHRVIQNIQNILSSANFLLDDVIKTTVFMTNLDDFDKMNKIYSEYFVNNPPARSTVQVSGLPLKAQIEIECIAIRK